MSNTNETNPDDEPQKIAIACQGGGSHTAFTAGVLKRRLAEIADRRDELSANLSLNQEVFFIGQVNEWVEEGTLSGEYKHVRVRRIQLVPGDETEEDVERTEGIDLSPASKLDRSPRHLRRLDALGDRRAGAFLERGRPVAPT